MKRPHNQIFKLLAKRLYNDLGVQLIDFKRLYPGKYQRADGAFTWRATAIIEGVKVSVGSTHTARELLKATSLSLVDGIITPK
jgi:hypothetical protein